MPRYVIQRNLGKVTEEDLRGAAIRSKNIREERFPDITWEHSHVVRSEDGFITFCIYDAPSAERAREHAQAAELPANAVYEILTDIHPDEL